MQRWMILALPLALATPALEAQPDLGRLLGGDLPPESKKGIEASLLARDQKGELATAKDLESALGADRAAAFLAGVLARVTLLPDGSFVSANRPGGELVAVRVGKRRYVPTAEAPAETGWVTRSGTFESPSRAQTVTLTLSAGGREMDVACIARYRKSDQPVTYTVGPLNGLFCLGLAGDDAAAQASTVRTADADPSASGSGG